MGKYGLPSAGGVSVEAIVGVRAWAPPVGVQSPDENFTRPWRHRAFVSNPSSDETNSSREIQTLEFVGASAHNYPEKANTALDSTIRLFLELG